MVPTIITRAGWGARETGLTVYTTTWSQRVGFAVHYSAGPPSQTVRAIQDFHISNGYGDIGYNWLVDTAGRVYEGRRHTWAAIGAHIRNHNTANIGVCFIGRDADVTAAAKASIRWLYDEANRLAGKTLAKRYHSLLASTQCPGDNLRQWVIAGMPGTEEDEMELTDPMIEYVGFTANVGQVLASAYSYSKTANDNAKAAGVAVGEVSGKVDALDDKVEALQVGGIDYDLLADKVADRLAARLAT